MSQTNKYKDLFQLTIYHGYHLDSGTRQFDSYTAAEKTAALLRFDVRTAFDILPTEATKKEIRNHRVLPISTSGGMLQKMQTESTTDKPLTGLGDATYFVYMLIAKNPSEFVYSTQLTEDRSRILLFTNFQPAECAATVQKLPLLTDATHISDTFLLSSTDTTAILDAYVPDDRPAGLIGVILIKTKGATAAYDLLDGSGNIKATCPQFKIHFNAKQTFWKYKRPAISFVVETKIAYPLTKYGFVDINPQTDFTVATTPAQRQYPYPNPSLGNLEKTLTKTYSVIFI